MFKRREGSRQKLAGKMPSGLTVGVFLFLLIGLGAGSADKTQAGLADHAVINEVSIQGASGAGGTYDDWIELYNPTGSAINLTGWSIQKTTSTGGSLGKTALNGSIPANGYFLIVRNNTGTAQALKDAADVLADDATFSLASNNIIYLVDDNVNIASTTNPTDPNIIDFVGLGTALYFEGSAAAANPAAGKSIARIPAGEDTDQNSLDFVSQDSPTPTGSSSAGGDDIGGTVLLTVTPDVAPVQNINSTSAQIFFSVNAAATAQINYGLTASYGSSTAPLAITANATTTINLTGLACNTAYHYVVYAENTGATENDTTADATFTTLPCGIRLDSLTMTKSSAKANNQYVNGWEWEFNITVWNMAETGLKMKFNQWSGAGALNAGGNMQFSADNGLNWVDIAVNGAYPASGADLSGLDADPAAAGRQVEIMVRMKVPAGTLAGYYNSSYGILTE